MSWQALETDAPELAREGRARFEATGVALLGTIRVDGTPRISRSSRSCSRASSCSAC